MVLTLKKIFKIILRGVITIIVLFIGYSIFITVFYSYHTDMKNYNRYIWIFNDSTKANVDTFDFVGHVKKNNILYTYKLKNTYILVWEFIDLSSIDLNKVVINKNINLDELKFYYGEIWNKDLLPLPKITVKYNLPFENIFEINLDENSKISKIINANNYKGFYGDISKMSLSNKKREYLILFDYRYHQPTLFLSYKGHNSFFIIIINSENLFDESIINILNLK
ncbi:MAG: hypothetical protein WCH34_04120 [Bacteroidota bacterium]